MGVEVELITPHQSYQLLGKTRSQRVMVYRSFFEESLSTEALKEIRESTKTEWVIGSEQFKRQIAEANGRRDQGWGGDRKSSKFFGG